MTRRMSVREARANFSDLIGSVYHTHVPVVIERNGKPAAVMVSPEEFELWRKQVMERFRQTLDELHALNADKSEEEVMRDVNEAVEEVRREQREREHSAR